MLKKREKNYDMEIKEGKRKKINKVMLKIY